MKNFSYFGTEEEKYILEKIESSIPKFESYLQKSYDYFYLLNKGELFADLNTSEIEKLFQYSTFLSINWLDISSAMSFYLKSSNNYQKLYSLRSLTVNLNEGYKRLHHFKEDKRKKSLWIENIEQLFAQNNLEEFKSKFNEITSELEIYESEFQTKEFQYERIIFVHYQGSPIEVYETFNNIDVQNLIKNTTRYLNVLDKMIIFSAKIFEKISKNYCS